MRDRGQNTGRRVAWALDVLFMALTGAYLLFLAEDTTTFSLPFPAGFEKTLFIALAVAAALRLIANGPLRLELVPALAMAGLYGLVYRSDHYRFLLFMGLITVGCVGLDYRRLLKTWLMTVGVFVGVTFIAALAGAIDNFVYIKNGIRSAWGICYPTDMASIALFAALMLWVTWKKLPDWAMLPICAACMLLSGRIARSTTSLVCGLLFFCAILYRMFEGTAMARRPGMRRVRKGVDLLLTASFPLFALAFFALMLMYHRGMHLGFKINGLLSDRLHLAVDAVRQYGLKPFGTPFDQIGAGGSMLPAAGYNFVDSSYPLILVRYGWVLLVVLGLTWAWTVRRAIRCGDRRLALAMGIIAFHAFSEHHFTECNYNLLLVMPFAAFAAGQRAAKPARRAGRVPAALATAAICAVCALALPRALTLLRTFFEAEGLCGGGRNGWRVIALLLVLLAALAGAIWAARRLARAVSGREPVRRATLAGGALLLCAGVLAGGFIRADRAGAAALDAQADLLEADAPAMEIVTAAATGGVYSDVLPAAYARRFGGVAPSVFSGEELARYHGATALMPADGECNVFFHTGCLYTQISDAHALYTSDRAVIQALTDAGYHLTGYYNRVRDVDLAAEARLNGLAYDPEDGLRLEGFEGSLIYGPYYDLYDGKYTVRYDLKLTEDVPPDATIVCTLRVSAYWGQSVLLEKEVRRNQFGEDGRLTASIPFTLYDGGRGVEFLAFTGEYELVTIEGIHLSRTPDCDVHTFYNDRLKVVRQECYTLEGAPTLSAEGYFAFENDYDRAGNVSRVRYFGLDGAPMLIGAGYAEVRRDYNVKKQVIREAYFGVDGQPVARPGGEAVNEREYDDAGNAVVNRYYGVDSQPVITTSGFAEVRRAFDDDRHVLREAYYGADGQPIALEGGQCAIEQAFDDAGNLAMRRFFGPDGAPMMIENGYAEIRWTYNGMRQVVREAFYGVDGAPIMVPSHQAANEREYDDAGNVTVYRYFDDAGLPVVTMWGYAELRREYDGARRVIREAYFGPDGAPMAQPLGHVAMTLGYDDAGNVAVRRYYGADGLPTLTSEGYAEVRREYDGAGRMVREAFFDVNAMPVMTSSHQAANEREYDDAGNVTVYRYFDTAGDPVVSMWGYAELRREYDGAGRVVREAYFGPDGAPMAQADGCVRLERAYDDAGNVAEERRYDAGGGLIGA